MRNEPFSTETALFLAAVCGQTYIQYANAKGTALIPRSYTLIGELLATSYDGQPERFGFVLESDTRLIVAFRGTSSTVDWISDFIARQIPYTPVRQGGKTHKGFTDIYMSARNSLLQLLRSRSSGKTLFVTGHSLGGALATLAALDLAVNTPFQPHVYTFAAPRAGDPRFVRRYNQAITDSWRVCNVYDIVPHLPTLVYKSPKTNEIYYYLHTKSEVKLSFKQGSVSGNHLLGSYFRQLALQSPIAAATICAYPPGWCPDF